MGERLRRMRGRLRFMVAHFRRMVAHFRKLDVPSCLTSLALHGLDGGRNARRGLAHVQFLPQFAKSLGLS